MRFISIYFRTFVFVCGVLLSATANSASGSSEVNELLDQAETLMHMGVVDKGASRSFEMARALVEKADDRFKELDLSPAETRRARAVSGGGGAGRSAEIGQYQPEDHQETIVMQVRID